MDSDWTKIWDGESGRFYYYNSITQLTTWNKPSIIVSIDNDSYNNNDINNSIKSADGSNDVIESLAWIELYDEDSCKYYYYNKDTYETTWIKPYEIASKQSITTATSTELNLKLWNAAGDGDYDAVVAAIADGGDVNDFHVSDNDI